MSEHIRSASPDGLPATPSTRRLEGARLQLPVAHLLMVLSGAAGLAWQMVWTAEFGAAMGHEIVAVLAVIGGLVILGLILRITFSLLPLLVLIGLGVFVYFLVQNASGRGR